MSCIEVVFLVNVETISIVIAAASVVIGVVSMIRSNRRAEEQRQMQLFTQLYDHLLTEQYAQNFRDVIMYEFKDYDDWLQQWTKRELPLSGKIGSIHRLLAYLCVVINKGLIDIELVDDIIARPIIQYWEKIEVFTMEQRKRLQDPTLGDDLEIAYHKLKQRRAQQIALARKQQATVDT